MSRYLLALELGGNLGHLSRVIPIARALRDRGHEVLLAVRDTRTAAPYCARWDLTYVQSPLSPRHPEAPKAPANYGEILLSEGFMDPVALRGRVEAWLGLFRIAGIDKIVADHAPTVLFAARIAGIPAYAIGSGFELPPLETPFPCFRTWENVPITRLEAADAKVLAHLNEVARVYGAPPLAALPELFTNAQRLFLTFRELDHYEPRPGVQYLGPLWDEDDALDGPEWPYPGETGVLAYLRAKVPGTAGLLNYLTENRVQGLAYIPDAPENWLEKAANTYLRITKKPLKLSALLPHAQTMICHGGLGTVSRALNTGTPVHLLPSTVEEYITSRKVTSLLAGMILDHQMRELNVHSFNNRHLQSDPFSVFGKHFMEKSLEQIVYLMNAMAIQKKRNDADTK